MNIEVSLDKLVKLGVLKKSKKGYIDSELCKEIDKMSSREAFMLGTDKSYSILRQTLKEIIEEIDNIFDFLNEHHYGMLRADENDFDKGAICAITKLKEDTKQLLLSKFGQDLMPKNYEVLEGK